MICLTMALFLQFLQIAQECLGEGAVARAEHQVTQSGRVPAFSIITIKGRAFAAQKPETTDTEKEKADAPQQAGKSKTSILPLAYQLIHRNIARSH